MSYFRLLYLTAFMFLFAGCSGCQMGYLWHVSYNHVSMLNSKTPVDTILKSDKLTEDQRKKILLTQEVRQFAFDKLKLYKSDNYTDFVELNRPYVTYAVMASPKWKLEPYLWDFPIIGKAPYKGFYSEELAKAEAELMRKKNYDTYVRGVPAFSTLGKLNDPLLSSMLSYKDHDLVNTIIHELTHTTLFIKDNIDFNERLAVFVANKGTELFYKSKEGENSKTVELINFENEDDKVFSEFITAELNDLKDWYNKFDSSKYTSDIEKEKIRQYRFEQIRQNFKVKAQPKLKTNSYRLFVSSTLNNAKLGTYNTYMKDLDIFEKVYAKNGSNVPQFLKKCAELQSVEDPEAELKKWAN